MGVVDRRVARIERARMPRSASNAAGVHGVSASTDVADKADVVQNIGVLLMFADCIISHMPGRSEALSQ